MERDDFVSSKWSTGNEKFEGAFWEGQIEGGGGPGTTP